MPNQQGAQGTTIRLTATYLDGNNQPTTPTTPLIDIINPSGAFVVTDAVPTATGPVGSFHYDYPIAAAAPLGLWRAHWTGVIAGQLREGDDYFEVVAAGAVVFPSAWITLIHAKEVTGLTTLTDQQLHDAEWDVFDAMRWTPVYGTDLVGEDHTTVRQREALGRAIAWQAAFRVSNPPTAYERDKKTESVGSYSVTYGDGSGSVPSSVSPRVHGILARNGLMRLTGHTSRRHSSGAEIIAVVT